MSSGGCDCCDVFLDTGEKYETAVNGFDELDEMDALDTLDALDVVEKALSQARICEAARGRRGVLAVVWMDCRTRLIRKKDEERKAKARRNISQ